jgi:hypothetical protein
MLHNDFIPFQKCMRVNMYYLEIELSKLNSFQIQNTIYKFAQTSFWSQNHNLNPWFLSIFDTDQRSLISDTIQTKRENHTLSICMSDTYIVA